MTSLLLVLLFQGGTVTVGDTLWIERVVGATGGAVIRPQPWSLGELGQQLGPGVVVQGSEGTLVRYPIVIWYPGEHLLTMPGPVLVKRDGSSDTLAASTVRVRVTSVLPAGAARTKTPPRPAIRAVPLAARSPVPLLALLLVVALLWTAGALFWRRRGRRPAPSPAPVPEPGQRRERPFHDPVSLSRWAEAGEYRAALDGWAWLLARKMAESRDLEETARIQQVLDEIADSVFSFRPPEYFAGLCGRAALLAGA